MIGRKSKGPAHSTHFAAARRRQHPRHPVRPLASADAPSPCHRRGGRSAPPFRTDATAPPACAARCRTDPAAPPRRWRLFKHPVLRNRRARGGRSFACTSPSQGDTMNAASRPARSRAWIWGIGLGMALAGCGGSGGGTPSLLGLTSTSTSTGTASSGTTTPTTPDTPNGGPRCQRARRDAHRTCGRPGRRQRPQLPLLRARLRPEALRLRAGGVQHRGQGQHP